jgi:hypothetical protein
MLFRFAKRFFQKSMEIPAYGKPAPRKTLQFSTVPGCCGKRKRRKRGNEKNPGKLSCRSPTFLLEAPPTRRALIFSDSALIQNGELSFSA